MEGQVEKLESDLKRIGIDGIPGYRIKAWLNTGEEAFRLGKYLERDDTKVKVVVKFQKQEDEYAIESYRATFIPRIEVKHSIINGVDTAELDNRMKSAGWFYFNEAETKEELEKAYYSVEGIKSDIEKLCQTPEGLQVATILWNKNVPFTSATKPEVILDFQDHGDFYISQDFGAHVPFDLAYKILEEKQKKVLVSSNIINEEVKPAQTIPPTVDHADLKMIFKGDDERLKDLFQDNWAKGANTVVIADWAGVKEWHHFNFFESAYEAAEFQYSITKDNAAYSTTSLNDLADHFDKWVSLKSNPEELYKYTESLLQKTDWDFKTATPYEKFLHGECQVIQGHYLTGLLNDFIGYDKARGLWEKYAPAAMDKPHFIIVNNAVMMEKELTNAESQLKRRGIAEAFTADLADRMKKREPVIAHPHEVRYANGDEAKATFNWKKDKASDYYYLNSWDLSVKKAGEENYVTKTFYINDPKKLGTINANREKSAKETGDQLRIDAAERSKERLVTTFTFKGSVNYLCERPVLNLYTNIKDNHQSAWDRATVRRDGTLDERSFKPGYGFDLKTVLEPYKVACLELHKPEAEKNLMASLQRGNFQAATFVEQGGQKTPYYLTPNIQTGYVEMYAQYAKDAKPLTPQQMADKGFVSQDFANKIVERMDQIEKQKEMYKQQRAEKFNDDPSKPAKKVTQKLS